MIKNNKYLVVIAGPTAVGKTDLAIHLAEEFDTEIISADSRQLYKELAVGTAKPSKEQLNKVKHHFIDSHSIFDNYNAGKFEMDAIGLLEKIHQEKSIVIAVGGSGLYINALCAGFDEIPEIHPSVREYLGNIYTKEGLEKIQSLLFKVDPEYYNDVDLMNPQRIIRALEVTYSAGRPYSSYKGKKVIGRNFHVIKIGLEIDRVALYNKIDSRMDAMIDSGLFEEAEMLYLFRHLNALQTVGYTEIFNYISGEYDKAEAIRLLKRNSRRYAKRQMTWFKKDPDIKWFDPKDVGTIKDYVKRQTMKEKHL